MVYRISWLGRLGIRTTSETVLHFTLSYDDGKQSHAFQKNSGALQPVGDCLMPFAPAPLLAKTALEQTAYEMGQAFGRACCCATPFVGLLLIGLLVLFIVSRSNAKKKRRRSRRDRHREEEDEQ
jgi:hypothetical protein